MVIDDKVKNKGEDPNDPLMNRGLVLEAVLEQLQDKYGRKYEGLTYNAAVKAILSGYGSDVDFKTVRPKYLAELVKSGLLKKGKNVYQIPRPKIFIRTLVNLIGDYLLLLRQKKPEGKSQQSYYRVICEVVRTIAKERRAPEWLLNKLPNDLYNNGYSLSFLLNHHYIEKSGKKGYKVNDRDEVEKHIRVKALREINNFSRKPPVGFDKYS